ncbi:alpha/beta fold hydrolase [Emcibacter sp.]|uniref:alpha/beta fold hydrolase n=1 Tax=Emcibacter sp. TaxID=1979954 RepID=UPI002AA7CCB9|nr:alpha/beta fold hydrolase [Emcibacter sp.]
MTDESPTQKIRTGPRPLPLHVANATSSWMSAAASLPLFLMGGLHCHPAREQAARLLRDELQKENMILLQQTVMMQAQERLIQMMQGIEAYQSHPYCRQVTQPPVALESGTTRLLDYGSEQTADGPVVIAVPSLINPSWILDLMEEHSLMRTLAAEGLRSYLVDWDAPGPLEKHFGLDDYIANRLVPMIREIARRHDRPVHLLGYCMGGNLSIAAAHILQGEGVLDSLTLIATPWDFHAERNVQLEGFLDIMEKSQNLFKDIGFVPMDIMQLFFFSLDPTLSDRKFRRFATLDPNDPKTEIFVAIEDWANEGAPLALNLAFDCLNRWYRDNLTHKGEWMVEGRAILPEEITLPCHVITPARDRIVPPASAKDILKHLPAATHTSAASGHVNMIAGYGADKILWPKIAKYIKYNYNK